MWEGLVALLPFDVDTAMRSISLLLLCLLVEVQSQTEYPYISFLGNTLPNHSYVDLSQVGYHQSDNTVQCHSDLDTCCRYTVGIHRGNWSAPGSGTRLPWPREEGGIYMDRQLQVLHLARRNNANGPSGIYRCVIPTNAVHDEVDGYVGETVYVGLYTSEGGM